jgi:large subunit ribosomal protein L30
MTPESGETDSPPIEGGEAAAAEKAATKATRAPRARAAKKAADGETASPRTATAKKVAKAAKAAPAKAAATKNPSAAAAKRAAPVSAASDVPDAGLAEPRARKAPARAAAAEAAPAVASIRVTQIRSGIGTKPKHRGTLRALGLRGVGRSNELPNRPEIRGMIARVPHLVKVEEVSS